MFPAKEKKQTTVIVRFSAPFVPSRLEEALNDLSGFDMIWVISHMHLNKGWNPKVRPPRLPEERKGLFSTRSPHRPNAIALSSLRVDRIDVPKGVIHVHGLDLLDGEDKETPYAVISSHENFCFESYHLITSSSPTSAPSWWLSRTGRECGSTACSRFVVVEFCAVWLACVRRENRIKRCRPPLVREYLTTSHC